MIELFRFYLPARWSQPSFGTNGAASTAWTMFLFSVSVLIGLILVVTTGRLFSASAVAGFFVLARMALPVARRLYEIDRVVRRHEQERRAKRDSWVDRQRM